jgi:hypothetical protein
VVEVHDRGHCRARSHIAPALFCMDSISHGSATCGGSRSNAPSAARQYFCTAGRHDLASNRITLMRCSIIWTVGLLVAAQCAASAQQIETKSNEFTFSTGASDGEMRRDQFCLPSTERLVNVIGVTVASSNAKSQVNVTPNLSSNCIEMEIQLPAAQRVCTNIPRVSGGLLPRIETEQKCSVIPAVIRFSVNYTSTAIASPDSRR